MHFSSVVNILGFLLMFLAAAMLLPVPFSLYYGDADYLALILSALITSAAGYVAFRLSKFHRDVRPKEGFTVVTLG